MTLHEPTTSEHLEALERASLRMEQVMGRVVQRFLARVQGAVRTGLSDQALPTESLVAVGEQFPLTLGLLYGWWQEVLPIVQAAVRSEWEQAYAATRSGTVTATSLDALDRYVAQVTDRLVRGLEPGLPEDAMDKVRLSITRGAGLGWSTAQTAEDIALALGWAPSRGRLFSAYEGYTQQIEDILDPLGPPGTPEREYARENDPRVRELQQARSQVAQQLDSDQSHWEMRANRIARTESTGAYNYANLRALVDEGRTHKRWQAAEDSRTRPSHNEADGQVVALDQRFQVGGSLLAMPGDPAGPPSETVNCRCVILGADAPS